VPISTQKLWTSLAALRGEAFCCVFGEAIREGCTVQATATLTRALNANMNTPLAGWPGGPEAPVPHTSTEENVTWRGGGFRDTAEIRDFFQEGREYHVAQPIASSFNKRIAQKYIKRAQLQGLVTAFVMWKFHFDNVEGCDHVIFLSETHRAGESEFLFLPFSHYKVRSVQWSSTPQNKAMPHVIEIDIVSDYLDASTLLRSYAEVVETDMLLAPWA